MKCDVGDYDLKNLLNLNEYTYTFQNGKYTVRIKAKRSEKSIHRPHGIEYCLTLHLQEHRIFGFDNAHPPPVPKRRNKYTGRIVKYDHAHLEEDDPGSPYKFKSCSQLLEDFWAEVNKITGGF
jgi:hypothetical protein